ncbi:hypothetical protein QJS10_CPA03g01833 [Acorus calamus]|uniref:Uncharacterized protein n=1 Tax=Acorus calamus TaxID=4465 RepID=A0AAV9F972_ACOCL|nr:hypothetical protein QJS10_CPA03g01833 [Acorus calamus]
MAVCEAHHKAQSEYSGFTCFILVIYGDHSLCVWDVRDVSKATRCFVVVPHGKCIWDVKNMPCKNLHSPALACVARGCQCGVSFTTCSADGTIRLWELASQSDSSTEHKGAICLKSCWVLEQDNGVEVDCLGFRSMAVDSDGSLLAAGDCHGNLHVLNLYTSGYTHIQKAHEAEILSLSFSSPGPKPDTEGPQPDSHHLLASGGRDQIIHVYDVERNFDLIESFDEHSSSVTSVKFTHAGHKLVSSSADRSLMVRDLDIVDAGCRILHRHQHIASLGTVYDMDIDPSMEFAVTIGQDKRISMYSLASGKLVRTFKPDGDRGETIKVSVDPSGSYLACTYSDKSMNIYDFTSGELVTRAAGHAEVITGVIFLPDCRHVVSVGGDSCIFIWKLPVLLSTNMLKKIMEHYGSLTPVSSTQSVCPTEGILDEGALQLANDKIISCLDQSNHGGETTCIKEEISEKNSIFKFSVSRLPKWAQTELMKSKQNVSGEDKEPETGDTHSTLKALTTEHLTPYQSKLGGSQVCTSVSPFSSSAGKSSPLPQGITEGFLYMEGQQGLKAVDITKIIQTPNNEVEINGKESRFDEQCKPGDILKTETSIPTNLSHEMVQLEPVIHTVLGKRSYSEAMETPMRKDTEVDICDEHSQGDDIFSQHFSTLSKPFKLFKMTSEDSVNSLGSSWTDQGKDISRVNTSNPAHIAVDPIDVSTIEHPFIENEINGNQSQDVPPNHGIPEKSAEYREALHNLESAAETVLRLYKDLGVGEDGKVVSGAHTQELFQLATQIIPSVEEKVRSLATLVHSSKSNSSSDIAVEAHLEPLIERYSERLTHQVLELVKKNL